MARFLGRIETAISRGQTLWLFVPAWAKALIVSALTTLGASWEGLPWSARFVLGLVAFAFTLIIVRLIDDAIEEARRPKRRCEELAILIRRGSEMLSLLVNTRCAPAQCDQAIQLQIQ